jgi:hypothetical protein
MAEGVVGPLAPQPSRVGLPIGIWAPCSPANLRFLVLAKRLAALAGIRRAFGKLLFPTPCSPLLGGKAVPE